MATLDTTTASALSGISSPTQGDAYYLTDTGKLAVYSGSAFNITNYDTSYNSGADEISNYSSTGDGAGDGWYAADHASLQIDPFAASGAQPLSIFAWVRPNSTVLSGTYWGIVGFGKAAVQEGRGLGLYQLKMTLYGYGAKSDADTALTVGVWSYVGYTLDTDGNLAFYLNGSPDGTATISWTEVSAFSPTAIFSLNPGSGATGYTLYGQIDQVGIWNDELSAAEVTALYNGGYASRYDVSHGNYTSHANLQAYWKMGDADSGTGTTITDSSTNSNDLTKINQAEIIGSHAPSKV